MGQAISALADAAADMAVAGIWRRGDDLDAILSSADVVIDFSLPEATEQVVAAAVRRERPLVCGVSGLADPQLQALNAAAAAIPVVYDRNMSLGVAVLMRTVRDAAAALDSDYRIHVAETHHVHKKDAPSGTALQLGEAIAAARGQSGTGEVSFESERIGEVPGEHTVTLASASETLTYGHSVTTRDVFAAGALHAARWVTSRDPGLFSMQDVLFAE